MDVVHRLLAEPALRQLPIQGANLKPVDGLQANVTQSGTDVFVNAHAVIASSIWTDAAAGGKPVFEVFAEGAAVALDVRAINNCRLKPVHGFHSCGLRRETAASALFSVRPNRRKVDPE